MSVLTVASVPLSIKLLASTNPMTPILLPIPSPWSCGRNGRNLNNLNIKLHFSTLQFKVNDATFKFPTVPVLLQIMNGVKTAEKL